MITKIFTGSALIICGTVFAQVGVNTDTPAATVDIVGKPTINTTFDGIIAPRIEGAQLRAKIYTAAQTGALVYVILADTAPAGQTIDVTAAGYYYFNGTKWVSTGSGSGTSVNIYNANGSLTNNRTLNFNGNNLSFQGTQQQTNFSDSGLKQTGLTDRANIELKSADVDGNGVSTYMTLQTFSDNYVKLSTTGDTNGMMFSAQGDINPASLEFRTSSGGGVTSKQRLFITGAGNIGINTDTPTEVFDNNGGVARLRYLPLNGAANAIYTTAAGAASATQNQTFTATRTVVADANGVLGSITGTPLITEVDGIIGNEVTNATTNGGLTRAGSGTAISPYTLGLTSGTATGQVMTWNGTLWSPTAPVNIYNADGILTNTRTLSQNGNTLTFSNGTGQSTTFSNSNGTGMVQRPGSTGRASLGLYDSSGSAALWLYADSGSAVQINATGSSTELSLATTATANPAPIVFGTSAGSNAASTEKMRITPTGNVGINTSNPTEKLDNNGITRLRTLPLNGATNATNTTSGGGLSASQNQTFTATKTLVADANGVIGYVTGIPTTSPTSAPTGSINVGESVSQIYSVPAATASASTFNLGTYVTANSLPALPVVDGLQISLQGSSTTYYDPRIYNTSAASQLVSYQSFATQVNENETSLNNTMTTGSFLQVDSNNIVFWTTTAAEVETTNVQVQVDASTYRWYEFKWWCMEISGTKKIFLSIMRKA